MLKFLTLMLSFVLIQVIADSHQSAVLINNITQAKHSVDGEINPGQIDFELKTAKLTLPNQEWAPAAAPITIQSGKIFTNQLGGHWQTVALPKSCLITVPLGSILTIAGKINNSGTISNLSCNLSIQKQTISTG